MTDAALARAFGAGARVVARRPASCASSFALEEVEVCSAGGRTERLLLKDGARRTPAGAHAKPRDLVDPGREVEAYRDVLAPRGLDVPALRACGEHWLLLEEVRGVPLWQTEGFEAWEAAARWLGALHRQPPPTHVRRLVRYDAARLGGWLARAAALVPSGALDPVAAVWPRVVARLAAWPRAFVHGDFYAANVLVEATPHGPRIRPVDWELAGIGPGLLDLAALTAGDWPARDRRRLTRAYAHAWSRPGAGIADDELEDALEHARVLVAVQWLGWSDAWSPPPEHEHDWLTDALEAAERIR